MNILRAALEHAAVSLTGNLARILPPHQINGLGSLIGNLVRLADCRHVRVALDNLSHAMPNVPEQQRKRIVEHLYQHLAQIFFELHQMVRLLPKGYSPHIGDEERRRLQDVLTQKRPVIFVTGHIGNWELAGGFLASLAPPLFIVARRMDNPFLERYLTSLRESLGMRVIHKHGAAKKLLPLLRSGARVGMVVDQNAPTDNLFVEFLGRKAAVVRTPALLAVKTGALVLPACCIRLGTLRYRLLVGECIEPAPTAETEEVTRITERFTSQLERWIRAYPEQWLWTHRRWKTRPPEEESDG